MRRVPKSWLFPGRRPAVRGRALSRKGLLAYPTAHLGTLLLPQRRCWVRVADAPGLVSGAPIRRSAIGVARSSEFVAVVTDCYCTSSGCWRRSCTRLADFSYHAGPGLLNEPHDGVVDDLGLSCGHGASSGDRVPDRLAAAAPNLRQPRKPVQERCPVPGHPLLAGEEGEGVPPETAHVVACWQVLTAALAPYRPGAVRGSRPVKAARRSQSSAPGAGEASAAKGAPGSTMLRY
jgi:hypothetical protein